MWWKRRLESKPANFKTPRPSVQCQPCRTFNFYRQNGKIFMKLRQRPSRPRPPRAHRRRPPENHHHLSPLAGSKRRGPIRGYPRVNPEVSRQLETAHLLVRDHVYLFSALCSAKLSIVRKNNRTMLRRTQCNYPPTLEFVYVPPVQAIAITAS